MSSVFPHLERSLHQCSVHCFQTLQLLPRIEVVSVVETLAVDDVAGLAFVVVDAVAVLGDIVVVMATDTAGVAFADESRGGVDQEEATAGLYVFVH